MGRVNAEMDNGEIDASFVAFNDALCRTNKQEAGLITLTGPHRSHMLNPMFLLRMIRMGDDAGNT